jgi:pimeloyl-ACP methyl ester carboxylesterase
MPNVLYLHGFASSPKSRKAQWFRNRLESAGIRISIPDLEGSDFRALTVSGMLERVKQAAGAEPVTLMGSSLGGYVAAIHAAMWPEKVDRLILMAPAFDFARRWVEGMGAEAAEQWRRTGGLRMMHYGKGTEEEIGWSLIEDAMRYPAEPQPSHPALVFHGADDEVVPVDAARRWCDGHAERRLVVYEDGHDLGQTLEPMWMETQAFLGIAGE